MNVVVGLDGNSSLHSPHYSMFHSPKFHSNVNHKHQSIDYFSPSLQLCVCSHRFLPLPPITLSWFSWECLPSQHCW